MSSNYSKNRLYTCLKRKQVLSSHLLAHKDTPNVHWHNFVYKKNFVHLIANLPELSIFAVKTLGPIVWAYSLPHIWPEQSTRIKYINKSTYWDWRHRKIICFQWQCKIFYCYNMHIWMNVWLIQVLVTPLSAPLLSAPRVHDSHQFYFGAIILHLKMKWQIDKWNRKLVMLLVRYFLPNTKLLLTKSCWKLTFAALQFTSVTAVTE